MPFVPAQNVIQVEVRYNWDGQQCENTLYYYVGGGVQSEQFAGMGSNIVNSWEAFAAPVVASNCLLTEVYITDLSAQDAPTGSFVPAAPVPGEANTASLPNNCSLAVSFRANARGRSARGRNYIVGLVEGGVNANQVVPSVADAWVDFYNSAAQNLLTNYNALWVILSRYTGGNPRAQGFTYPVASVGVRDYTVDSQRRRLPGRGN